jgi:hypothetical protein
MPRVPVFVSTFTAARPGMRPAVTADTVAAQARILLRRATIKHGRIDVYRFNLTSGDDFWAVNRKNRNSGRRIGGCWQTVIQCREAAAVRARVRL